MTEKKKIEVNLEMCSGFFRIPTEDVVYNITILPSSESSATKIVEKIIEVEKIVEVEKLVPAAPQEKAVAPAPVTVIDDYFKQAAQTFHQEISTVAEAAGSAAGGPDLSALRDVIDMACDLKDVLLAMKKRALEMSGGNPSPVASGLEEIVVKIAQAKGLCAPAAGALAASSPAATKTVTRYLFNLDTVFQTIYELCTNETVKTHIKNARARVDEIFNKEVFYDAISPKVPGYGEDDGFMNVPMTDIYLALGTACSEAGIKNLLTKMDQQQASIFLDQFLLMEVPPRQEVALAEEGLDVPPPSTTAPDSGLYRLLDECQGALDALVANNGGQATAPADLGDLLNSMDDAINIIASIQHDAKHLAEGSEGGEGTPLWLKIRGLAALTATLLSRKEADASLTFAKGLEAGQGAAQRCLADNAPPPKAPASPAPAKKEAPAPPPAPAQNFGEASQDDIDRLLEELG